MMVGVMNETLRLESIALQIRATERVADVNRGFSRLLQESQHSP